MADRPDVTPAAGAVNDAEAALARHRGRIDALDARLLALLNERATEVLAVGAIKHAHGLPVRRLEREAQVVSTLQAANPGPLPAQAVADIWREIMSAAVQMEAPQRVAFLGPPGTFSEDAAISRFGHAVSRLACPSFDEVFRTVEAGGAEFGIVPIENSTEGQVGRSLDLLLTTPLAIVGEVALLVRHNLLRREPGRDGIARVLAHPQALGQCHRWLSQHLPGAERVAVASNADGARRAADDPACAAIASRRAAGTFGLHLLAEGIQDEAQNRTRFAVVADPARQPLPRPTERDVTSLVVSVPNRPGAMHDLLVPLKTHGVSMTRIESRPARTAQWEYHFYIDVEGHADEPRLAAALDALRAQCAFYKRLGSYPAAAAA